MQSYFIRRLLMMFPLMLLISFVAFVLLNLAPSDPAEIALRINAVTITDDVIADMRHQLGLDLPFLQRYLNWLWHIIHLDLGRSFLNNQPVLSEILHALPITLYLAFSALIIILVVSFGGALICVIYPNSKWDQSIRAVLFIFTAIPNYWLALLLIWGFAVHFNCFPSNGLSQASGIILPALSLSLGYIGTYLRLIRGTMLNQLEQPYVFYARARGLSSSQILFKHVLRNSLHSILVALGMGIPKLIAGSVVIENIFALPGIGRLCIQAIFGRDYPMIQAYILLMAVLFLCFNFMIDLLQHHLDPRLRRGK
ncbi:nickel/cobalt ABC transporter permease [Mannheimia massilioguelmaensis]|uniref:nickel/cobalt ABC transporter permease n=1 Tax=Mannheimia massilioguelmaensis TaxID=1604354 RepID=UPI0005C962E3|nr:nickel/cobalt ABC transporter permease [Mannheimia massilioguelmaensis]